MADSRAVRDRDPAPAPPSRGAPRREGRQRRMGLLLALLGLLAVAVVASLAIGSRPLPPAQVWSALTGPATDQAGVIVTQLRVPRTVLGVLVGVSLAVAGALLQGHTRNPIADPTILGVSAGSAFAVVLGLRFVTDGPATATVWYALAGAALATLLVDRVAGRSRMGATPVTLALTGVAVAAMLSAATSAIVLLSSSTLDSYRFWAVGALVGRGDGVAWEVLPFLLVGLALAVANVRSLDLLALGDDTAKALGVKPARARTVGLAAVALLVGGSVAAAGPIAFLALVAPHLARRLMGADYRWLMPAAALLGPTLLLTADIVGRVIARPGELQVGIITGVVGAPVFVAVVRSGKLVLR